ncbi:MAG: hypothetical protein IT259_09305 [Saprospiraceae bacterium]|nr:hypothetical protein [Saprospiraceae bacterium]
MHTTPNLDRIELVHSGEDYFTRLKAVITGAREVLHVQVYILEWDDTGKAAIGWMADAARRGVRVFLLADHFGSSQLPGIALEQIREAGIRFRFFAPPYSIERLAFGRTMHHKIVVADEQIALIGGINIADRYRIGVETERVWLDFAVQIEGPVCRQPHLVCERLFRQKPAPKRLLAGHIDHLKLRFLRNDWMRRRTEIYRSCRDAVKNARQSVTMAASYFLPEKSFRRLLARAAARGVEVRIILSGPSDVPLARLAEHYLHRYLLYKGIRLFEWRPSVLHAKVMTADGRWTSVGSYNLNHLSRYRSIEFNVEITDKPFTQMLEQHLDELIREHCVEITAENAQVLHNPWHRFKSWLAYTVHRTMVVMYLSRRLYDS